MPEPGSHSALQLPDGFVVPQKLETERYLLEPLAEVHTERDYEAVMETAERLRASAPNGWPAEGFTLAENRADLIQHEQEFAAGTNFAFTVLSPDRSEVLGCVYFNPPGEGRSGVDVHLWVREREYNSGLALHLHRHVDAWLRNDWPFAPINYLRPDYYFALGSCLCGQVSYYAGPVVGPFELCHCSRCRRATGSAFAAAVGVGDVRFISGVDQIERFELPIINQPPAYGRYFCRSCGALLPNPDANGWQEVPAGGLNVLDLTPDRHIYVDDVPEWSLAEASLPVFTAQEIREYRRKQGGH